jgi:hypothetical protein
VRFTKKLHAIAFLGAFAAAGALVAGGSNMSLSEVVEGYKKNKAQCQTKNSDPQKRDDCIKKAYERALNLKKCIPSSDKEKLKGELDKA